MRKDWVYRRGDLYLADLSPVTGSEQGGVRPVLVIQNNIGNFYAPTLIVAMITTKKKGIQECQDLTDYIKGEQSIFFLYPLGERE